jgi:hypothetical protein
MLLDRGAYLVWRLGQGEVRRGLATRWRRIRGVYDETEASDMVEYHVVRKGVDEKALEALLRRNFDRVTLWTYWSTQSPRLQRFGYNRKGWDSDFGLTAIGRTEAGRSSLH